MSRIIEVEVFTLHELKERAEQGKAEAKAYERALHTLREWVGDDEWWRIELEQRKERLAELGYEDADIAFGLAYSQGDGASFTGTVDLEKFVYRYYTGKEQRNMLRAVRATAAYANLVRMSHYYAHPFTVDLDMYPEWSMPLRIERLLTALKNDVLEDAREEMNQIYRALEKEYDYLTGEEALLEMAEANEYEFTASGSIPPRGR